MFKERTGLAPGQYLQKIRITSAMYLLRNTEMPVKNIAFECGFKTSEYFCTVFLDATGMSPGKYREANLVSEA
jgi:AraC-like DNA-binding protein